MKAFAESLYKSKQWQDLRNIYMSSKNWICERCGRPATVCHHRKYVTEENINNPGITLNIENLEALCRDCHEIEHRRKSFFEKHSGGISFDEKGNIIKKSDVFIIVGAPGSGKSYYVKQHKNADDLVLDLDYICAALMQEQELYLNHEPVLAVALDVREAIYKSVESRKGKWRFCWIITSSNDQLLIKALAFRLRAEVIRMEATLEECIENIRRDDRRKEKEVFERLVQEWFKSPLDLG